jgi:hypothetical protein
MPPPPPGSKFRDSKKTKPWHSYCTAGLRLWLVIGRYESNIIGLKNDTADVTYMYGLILLVAWSNKDIHLPNASGEQCYE